MIRACVLLVCCSLALVPVLAAARSTRIVATPELHGRMLTPLWRVWKPQALPSSYDVRNISGINYAAPIRSQMVPVFCGSCWAFATTSSLNDRLKLLRQNAYPDFELSPQELLNCANIHGLAGCSGGSASKAFEWIYQNGIVDETCAPYLALQQVCGSAARCNFCDDGGYGCKPVSKKHYQLLYVSEWGKLPSNTSSLSMELQMMSEIQARGPIACNVDTDDEFDYHYDGGVMLARPWKTTNHVVTVSGWGTTTLNNGTEVPYWLVRNSYGTWWGERGWFMIQRGVNALGIESDCAWGVPSLTNQTSRTEA